MQENPDRVATRRELILKDEVYAVAGAAMEVYYVLGAGFLEPVYRETLALEFNGRGIPYVREKRLEMFYKGTMLSKTYCSDFVCYDQIIVELKSQTRLSGLDEA